MHKTIIYILLVISTSILLGTACTNKRADQDMAILNHVNSLLAIDSIHEAFELLKKESPRFTDKSQRITMFYQLTRYRAMDQNFIPLTDDSMMTQVEQYYAKNGNTNEQTLSRYLLAACYRDMNLYADCQKWANMAEEEADTLDANFNFDYLYKVCCMRAYVFLYIFDYQLSLEDYYRAAYYAKKSGNKLKMTEALFRAGHVHILLKNYDKAKQLIKRCITLYEECKVKNPVFVTSCLLQLAEIEIAENHAEKAGQYLAEAEKKANGQFAYNSFILGNGLTAYLPHKGDWYELNNDYQSALSYSKREYALGGDYQGFACYKLAERLYKLGSVDSAYIYMKRFALFKDSIQTKQRAQELQAYQTHFKIMGSRQQIEKAQREKNIYAAFLILSSIIIVAGVALVVVYIRNKKRKEKQLKTDYSLICADLEELRKQKKGEEATSDKKTEEECEKLIDKLEKETKQISKKQRNIEKAEKLTHKLRNSAACREFYQKLYKNEKINDEDIEKLKMCLQEYCPATYEFLEGMISDQHLNDIQYQICLLELFEVKTGDCAKILLRSNSCISVNKGRANQVLFDELSSVNLRINLLFVQVKAKKKRI